MPSKTFQPLLFDLLTYKLPNTTYFDHYCKKKRRIYANGASAAARTASTANLSQKQKMALMMKRSRPFTSTNQLYEAYKANLAQFDPVSVQNNTASKAVKTAATNIKIQNILDDQSAAEASQAQTNFKAYILSPPPSPTNAKVNFADDFIASDEQLANLTQNVLQLDNNNDESKLLSQSQPHWMVYPEEKTPEYILDAKKRLNQIRQPNLVPSSSPSSSSKQHKVKISDEPVEIIGSDGKPMTDDEKRHWLSWPNPATPDKIREIRRRLGDDRYRKTAEMKSMLSKRPKTAYYSATIDATNQEEGKYIRPKTAVITTTTKNVAEPSNTKTVVTTEIVDPSSQFIVSYSPTMGNESALRQVSYEKLLEDSYVNSKSNYFDSNNNSFVNSSEFVNSGGMMCNYATVEDPLISASCQGKQTSDEMPLEAWINKANENDREAVLRILNRVNSGQSTMQRSRVKSGVVSSYSKPPLPPSQASIPQYDYTPTDRSNQYVRVKAVHSRPQHQPSTPLPVHLRSLIDVDTPVTTNRKGASSRAKSSTGVRKLGVLRNNYQLRNDDETEKILLNHNLLTAQMIGPESVHYGYNV